MSYVPGFENDLFISYAHVDNLPRDAGEEGWVKKFRDSLEIRLRQIIGRAEGLTLWRDPAIQGNAPFDETIRTAFRDSAALVSILSPSYLESDWCQQELSQFCTIAGDKLKIKGNSRLFKVVLSQVAIEDQPSPLPGLIGYHFFELDRETSREKRFRRTKEDDPDQRYWEKLDDLAHDIAQLLQSLKQEKSSATNANPQPQSPVVESQPSPSVSPSNATAVYLAEVTDDLDDYRDQLRRTLSDRGIRVLPESPLAPQSPNCAEAIRQSLRSAVLSVHLVGQYYGKKLAGERSLTHIQCDLAAEIAREAQHAQPFSRFIWTPRELDLNTLNPTQRDFLQTLESASDPLAPTEMLRVGIEELKDIILARAQPPAPASQETLEEPLVCIACAPEDSGSARMIRDFLFTQQKMDVVLTSPGTDEEALKRRLRTNMQHCDALLIFYGQVSPDWVEDTALEARALTKSRTKRPLMCIYDGPPPEKEEVRTYFQNLLIIKSREPFRAESLSDFLRRLGRRL